MDPVEPWIDGNAVRQLAARLLSSPDADEIADSPDAGFGPGFEGFTSSEGAVRSRTPLPPSVSPPREVAPQVELAPRSVPAPPEARPVPQPAPVSEPVPEPQTQVTREVPVSKPAPEAEAKPFLAAAPAKSNLEVEKTESDQAFRRREEASAEPQKDAKRGPLMDRLLQFRDWLSRNAKARSVFILDREGQVVLDDPAYAKLHFLARSLSNAYRPVPGQPGNVHVKVGAEAYLVVIPVETTFGCLVLGTVLPKPLDAPSVEIVTKALADVAQPRRK
ncbi:MAG: hypothetical protein AAGI48_17785 [Verrucomicrobiota bacterium]